MELSSAAVLPAGSTHLTRHRPDGTPVYAYRRLPGLPPVSVLRFHGDPLPTTLPHGAHTHDFLVLAYFETGGGSVLINDRDWPIAAGDAFVIAPGEVIAPGPVRAPAGVPPPGQPAHAAAHAAAWAVFFPLDVLNATTTTTFQSWHAHPLLFPFLAGAGARAQRLQVPSQDRPTWSERFGCLERELLARRDGYDEAALAHLTLLLIDVSRLAANVPANLALQDEPLLATVFNLIESGYHQPISLQHIAAATGLSPGHLTTVVGRKTGRTVQQWITERRMSQARRLLADTELSVETIATRVGYRDVSYFIRTFRRDHGTTPLQWRRAGHRTNRPYSNSNSNSTAQHHLAGDTVQHEAVNSTK